jgi:hypothetical protein
VDFFLISLKEFSEGEGKLAVIGAFKFSWIDNRLAWNPKSYGNDLMDTSVLQDTLWIPNFVNLNCFENMRPLGSNSMSVRVYSGGLVVWLPPALVESTCDADVRNYPFDSQTCIIRYYVPGFYPQHLNLTPSATEVSLIQYEENNLWDITSTSQTTATNSYGFQEYNIQIQMKRRSSYYIAGLILPICLMSFLQVMVYILPEESGERIGFSITVLLAVAVFLTIIPENLPEASEPSVYILAYKLWGDVLIGALITTSAIFGSAIYHKNGPVPSIIQRLLSARKKSCCEKSQKVSTINVTEKSPSEEAESVSDDDVISWTDVGKCFDKWCLFIFTLCLAINNIVIVIIISTN